MERKSKFNPYGTLNALYASFAVALFQYLLITTASFILFKDNIIVPSWTIVSDVIVSYLCSVALLFILFKYAFWMAKQNLSRIKKHLFTLSGLIILTVPLSLFFSMVLDWLLFNPTMYLENIVSKKLMQDMVFAFIVFLITVSIYAIMYNQKIEAESARNRYEALKNQLDPHFLFNSLNALDGLIGYDDEKAHRYLQKLSQTFRYTIQNKEVTELSEELKLVDAYSYLMHIRYGDSLSVEMNIAERHLSSLILPVSLQLLVENAIKHNTINDRYPLTILMETTDNDTIRVSNNKNPKLEKTSRSRIGLTNLAERYALIFGKEIRIEDKEEYFAVELPLTEQSSVN